MLLKIITLILLIKKIVLLNFHYVKCSIECETFMNIFKVDFQF
jgi:hypothetical protein